MAKTIFKWIRALWSPTAKALKEARSALETGSAVATAPAPGAATPGWASTVKSPNAP